MTNTFPSYFKKFVCIADKCPDTCCAGWQIVVDPESLNRYNSLEGDYAQKIRSLITVDNDGDSVFIPKNNRCPFLLENGLCEMYCKLNHDALCRTCRQFPRHITYFGARLETGISLSCPEAARIIMESPEPITFETEETHGSILPTAIDPSLYFTLVSARKTAIKILQNREFAIESRIISFLLFCEKVSALIRKKEFEETRELEAEDFENTASAIHSPLRAKKALAKYFADFKSLEMLDSSWKESLEKAENARIPEAKGFEWEYEHLMIYFVFRYFMAAVFDGSLLPKAKFAAVAFIIIRRLQAEVMSEKAERVKAMQKFSKEVEHSANNMDFINSSIKKSRFYSIENLISILEEIK
jgi:lysine-N-methylase